MQIILLSGGSGTRLWPLSNDARSKQFLKILPLNEGDGTESMIQRIVRQIKESGLNCEITVATSASQRDAVASQVGEYVDIVTEPARRHTFPAVCLACEYLHKIKKCKEDEPVVVIPCDPFTEIEYFDTIGKMAEGIIKNEFPLILMGIRPVFPSTKYGYVLPLKKTSNDSERNDGIVPVAQFKEKPGVEMAAKLIEEGALWNAGVYAFKLGFLLNLAGRYFLNESFSGYYDNYAKFPKTSFDYEVAEKTEGCGVIRFDGYWKDLGTWNTLTDEIKIKSFGNVITDETIENTHIFNELNIPLLCIGTKDLVVAASPDGIIVSEKTKSENVKNFASCLKKRPMYEERRWGSYKVIDYVEFPDRFYALTKQLTLNPGCSISYQRHSCRDEVWTFIDGEGEIVLDGERKPVRRGDVINISKGQMHALKAHTSLTFIEVQHGSNLIEEDIERFPFEW